MGNQGLKAENEASEAPITPEELEKLHRKRAAIVNEILSTEKSYVSALRSVVTVWYQPLDNAIKAGKPIINRQEFTAIFSIIRDILDLHEKILIEIQGRVSNWSKKQLIGDVFVAHAEALKLYTEYVNNYSHALETVGHCQKKESIRQFFEEGTEHTLNEQKLDIVSYLIMPIQRIPRYQLLIQDLKNSTRRKHKDYRNLSLALQEIISAATYINEQKRVYEETSKLVHVQQMLNDDYDIIAPHRRVISDGYFLPLAENTSTTAALKWILCNDLLIIASETKSFFSRQMRYNVSLMAPIFDTEVSEIPSTTNNAIKIQYKDTVVYYGFETPLFMNSWIKQYEEVRKNSFQHRLLTEASFPKKEISLLQSSSTNDTINNTPKPVSDSRKGSVARKQSTKIVEEEQIGRKQSDPKTKKEKQKEKKVKNFNEALREPLLKDKKKKKEKKKKNKKSKKGNKVSEEDTACCKCF